MLEMHPSSGDFNLNVVQAHRNVFIAQKLIEQVLKYFTPGNFTIDWLDDFPSESSQHTSLFNDVTKYPKPSEFT